MIGARGPRGNLEVITIDLICEVCGTSNPPGTEFCTNCNSYLAWDRSVLTKPSGKPAQPTSPAPTPRPQPQNEWVGQTQPAGSAAAAYPNVAPAEQGYVDPGSAGQGYPAPGLLRPGIRPRRLLPVAGYAPTLGAVYRHELPELRHDQPSYSPLLLPLRLRIRLRRVTPYAGYAYWSPQARPPRTGRAEGVPAVAAAALPLAASDHRRSGGGVARAARPLLRTNPVEVVKSGWYSLTRDVRLGQAGHRHRRAARGKRA